MEPAPNESPSHPAASSDDRLLAECRFRQTRRGGPGGQHRNKVETAVVVEHLPTGTLAEAAERRSAAENRRVAVRRLRMRLAIEVRTPPPCAPSPRWRQRLGASRLAVSRDAADLPALVAEALDVLLAQAGSLAAAAACLEVTPTRLNKLLRLEPGALGAANAIRNDQGLPPLR